MAESKMCPKCGAALPDNAPGGVCPKCLMQAGLASDPDGGSSPEMKPTSLASGFVPPEPEELAKHFPQLEILELLGKGGMGAVYKARQPRLDRLVAVKILPPEVAADPAFAERFTREARALARLSHQNIVAVFDFGQAEGLYYFIMEYVDGANLRQLIATGGLKPEEALAIVPQICEALQFAHNEGIVHRDIKPENILVDKQGRVKIADFGLAKLLGKAPADFTLTGTQQVMGTLHYMAPEQMRGAGAVDHRADIYSLGVVFYELLTGELPMGRFAPPSKRVVVDVRLDEIVLRTLEQNPEQRYQHASDVKTDVETISRSKQPGSPAHPESAKGLVTALQLVQAPADCLLLAAGIAFVTACGVATWLLAVPAYSSDEFTDSMVRGNLRGMSVGLAIHSVFIGIAGLMLRRLQARLAVLLISVIVGLFFPAVAALNVVMEVRNIPQWPVVIPLWLGMPPALWVVVTLFRADVRRAFDTAAEQRRLRGFSDPPQQFPSITSEPRRRIPIAAWIGVVPFVVIYVAASAELQNQGDATTVRAVAQASLCFAAVYLSVYAVIALVRRSRGLADQPALAEPRAWRIAMFFSLLLFFTALFVFNWVGKPFGGSAARLRLLVAGPHVEVSLNGEKVAVTDKGEAVMHMRPGDYEVVGLKDGQVSVSSIHFIHSGVRITMENREADAIRVTGPLTLEYGPGSSQPTIADFTAIQGRWDIVTQVKGNQRILEAQSGKWIEFVNDVMRSDVPKTPLYQPFLAEARFAINSAKAPPHFEIVALGAKGIYRLDGDTLTLAIADAGHPRPSEFMAQYGTSVTLTVCRRAKAATSPVEVAQ